MQCNPPVKLKYAFYDKEVEPLEKQCLLSIMSRYHQALKVLETGLVVYADEPFVGASSDGIVTCHCHENAVLEIRCPYKYMDDLSNWEHDKEFPVDREFSMKQDNVYYFKFNCKWRWQMLVYTP